MVCTTAGDRTTNPACCLVTVPTAFSSVCCCCCCCRSLIRGKFLKSQTSLLVRRLSQILRKWLFVIFDQRSIFHPQCVYVIPHTIPFSLLQWFTAYRCKITITEYLLRPSCCLPNFDKLSVSIKVTYFS